MPVIFTLPSDPGNLLVLGEELRRQALSSPVAENSAWAWAMPVAGANALEVVMSAATTPVAVGMTPAGVMDFPRVTATGTGKQIRVNACIATTAGAIIPTNSLECLINSRPTHTGRWSLAGVTKDSTGAALADCRVVAFETGRMGVDGLDSTVGETISDGSGNYSIEASLNVGHQLTGYKPGSPDVAGITRNDVTPTAVA